MFSYFFKITLRNFYREKMYALINIAGLSVAIACCLVIGLWLRSELTYDRHNVHYEQIFRVIKTDSSENTLNIPLTMAPLLAENHHEIQDFVRFASIGMREAPFIRHGDKVFQWKHIWYADNSVFDMFTHDIIYGNPETALDDPTSVAVSRTFSEKYFGDADPVGETINFNEKTYNIKLVFEDLPDNTSLKYDILVSFLEKEMANSAAGINTLKISGCITYLLMPPGYDTQEFNRIFDIFRSNYKGERIFLDRYDLWLQPMADIHFNSIIRDANTANKFYIYGFEIVAVFILLVACINYMNLATARASRRTKEIAIRKILGVNKVALKIQFLCEAVFFSLIALFLGLILVEIALTFSPIDDILNKHLVLNFRHEPGLLLLMLAFSLGVGLISGAYPAFYLSSIPVLSGLTDGHRSGKKNIRFRQILVLIQFTITVGVIACTLIMALQMRYVSQKPLGFEKDDRIIITLYGTDVIDKIPALKIELLKNRSILGLTESNLKTGHNAGRLRLVGMDGEDTVIAYLLVGDNFFEEMGMKIVTGRDFSKELLTDVGASVVVNEATVKKMGWNEPLGKRLLQFQVVGVVKDFNFTSLYNTVEPLVLIPLDYPDFNRLFRYRQLTIHISNENISETLSFLEEKFAEFDPEHPFDYDFMDESLYQLYISDKRMMKLTGIFACVCIFISCLGLFGLASFTTEQRTKEIGIRKVLGASTFQIITMLVRNVLLLVLGGAVIASLVAYYIMDEWLSSFAYRTGINPMVFLISAVVAAGVAFITVALQSYKTARANPVKALRYE